MKRAAIRAPREITVNLQTGRGLRKNLNRRSRVAVFRGELKLHCPGIVRIVGFGNQEIGIHVHFKNVGAIREAVDLCELARDLRRILILPTDRKPLIRITVLISSWPGGRKVRRVIRYTKSLFPRGLQLSLRQSRSEEHTSELQSHSDLVCRLLLEKKKNT